jgi:hypothetical protein
MTYNPDAANYSVETTTAQPSATAAAPIAPAAATPSPNNPGGFGQAQRATTLPQPELRRNPVLGGSIDAPRPTASPAAAQIANKQESLANLLKQFRT